MPKYLVQASYTAGGLARLRKSKASGRQVAVSKALASLGGTVEAMYYAFGDYDAIVVADLPDNVSAAAFSAAVSAAGLARTKTTPLLTVEETDQALEKDVDYAPPSA